MPSSPRFALSDGQSREETIELNAADGTIRAHGRYAFRDAKTGRRYSVKYVADENGFRANVTDLPSIHRKLPHQATRPQDESEISCALRNSLCGKK